MTALFWFALVAVVIGLFLNMFAASCVAFVSRHLPPDRSGNFEPLFFVARMVEASRVVRIKRANRTLFLGFTKHLRLADQKSLGLGALQTSSSTEISARAAGVR